VFSSKNLVNLAGMTHKRARHVIDQNKSMNSDQYHQYGQKFHINGQQQNQSVNNHHVNNINGEYTDLHDDNVYKNSLDNSCSSRKRQFHTSDCVKIDCGELTE